MGTLYLCGAGNSEGLRLAHRINEAQQRWDRLLLLDDDVTRHGHKLLDVEIAGPFSLLDAACPETSETVNLVARTTRGRRAARRKIEAYGVPFASLVSAAVDTLGAEVSRDAIVYQNATIGPEASVGGGSVVFMGAVVGHEARVGRDCVMAANSVLNARVVLGEGVYVGTNATVLPEVTVGAWATIGAGSVVVEDVPEGATVMGVPAEILMDPHIAGHGRTERAADVAPARIDAELESAVTEVWQELLELAEVDVDVSFFELGGGSLLAVRMRDQLQQVTGQKVPLTDIFRFPTIRSLAAHIASDAAGVSHIPGEREMSRAEVRRDFHKRWRNRTY